MRRLSLIALAAPLLFAAPLWAQEPAAPAPMAGHAHAMGPGMGAGGGCGGGGECPGMAIMAKMDSANAQIADLTAAMNAASGSKKTEAMAALLNAMVQDRLMMEGMLKLMHAHMEKMMMGGMGGMKGMGGNGACSPGMECCKGAGGAGCGAAATPAPEQKE
ncbi:MAG: hypothetical protein R2910_03930 [Gemmatimonadales bacterium]